MNLIVRQTHPQHFGRYDIPKFPTRAFLTCLGLTIVFFWLGYHLFLLIGIVALCVLVVKDGYLSGLADATELPVAPTLGQANMRVTYTRRTVRYRGFLFLRRRPITQLVVFIAVSELAKARLRDARAWNNVLYIYKFSYKPGDESQYHYRLRDIVEKGPLIFEKLDINELNAIEDDIRAAVDNLARYVKNLSEDQARSSTETVEY